MKKSPDKIRRHVEVRACWPVLLVLIGTAQAQTWLQIEATGSETPPPRTFAAAIHDPRGERMILFGGRGPDGDLNDLWTLNLQQLESGARWTRVETASEAVPAARFTHNAVYDPHAHRMLVWAGRKVDSAGSAFFNDVWAYDIESSTWTELEAGEPQPNTRYGTAAVFDPVAGTLVTFAGFTAAGRFEDTWRFDPRAAAWTEISPEDGNPGRRCLHSASYDATRHRMLIYGGQPGPLDDIWALDLVTQRWSELTPPERPGGRFYTANVYDAGNDRVLVFAGNLGSPGLSNELWSFDLKLETWTLLEPMGDPPAPREGATAIFLEGQGRMVAFGGTTDTHTNELWVFDGLSATTAVAESGEAGQPQQSVLHQNYPNPFNASTAIAFELTEQAKVNLTVYDLLGRKVRNLVTGIRNPGWQEILWDGTDDTGQPVSSGTYIYELKTTQSSYRKLLILR